MSACRDGGDFFFGWDLLFKTVQARVSKASDVLVAFTHFVMVKHSKFTCIGVGEEKTIGENENGSEVLPDGWNDDEHRYALRYLHDKKLYVLIANLVDDQLLFNLLDADSVNVSNISVAIDDVKGTQGTLKDMLPNACVISERVRKELVEPVFSGNTREGATQTVSEREMRHPHRCFVPETHYPAGREERMPFGFPEVGRGDLDPLGRGGGNLFVGPGRDPFYPRAPPGMPGSPGRPRFDPYGPLVPGLPPNPNPNPDHFQPPGWGGNQFM